jgi:hypothetical protein
MDSHASVWNAFIPAIAAGRGWTATWVLALSALGRYGLHGGGRRLAYVTMDTRARLRRVL